jgi:hypothetical protein
MGFESFLSEAWAEHGEQPAAIAERLASSLALVQETAQIPRYAQLVAHVFGEHLGEWQPGLALLAALSALPACTPGGEAEAAIRRLSAALRLARGDDNHDASALSRSEQARVFALAAAALTGRGQTTRAGQLFEDALELAGALANDDPAQRALAVTGNNLAAELEEKSERTSSERELMLLAARAARARWELAGTWLEVERAENRLAHSCLAAGELLAARAHASECLAICRTNSADARELFWGFECLARIEHARQDGAAFGAALGSAKAILLELGEPARGYAERALEALLRLG